MKRMAQEQRRLDFDSQFVEQSSKLLSSATKMARGCFSDEEIVDPVNRSLQEAAAEDQVEQAAWETNFPELF